MRAENILSSPANRLAGRSLKKTLTILSILLLGLLAVVLIWAARRYQNLVGFGKHVQEQVQSINKAYPFTPPPTGSSPLHARISAMLRVRERMLARVDPAIEEELQQLLKASDKKDPMLLFDLSSLAVSLKPVFDEQMTALRLEQMSVREYQWLLGLVIYQAMASPTKHGAGAAYWKILRQAERLSGQTGGGINADRAFHLLQKEYNGDAMDAHNLADQLHQPGLAPYALDWTVLAAPRD